MRRLAGIIMLLSLLFVPTAAAQKGSSQRLPADLLYVTLGDLEGTDYQRPNTLMRLNAETLTSSVFYYDPSVWIQLIPVAWSPNGMYLAVIRDSGGDALDLCLVTYKSIQTRCFEKVINRDKYGYRMQNHQPYWVTWSGDGQSIYFYQDEGDTIRLVEADIASSDVVRTVYEQTKPYPQNMAAFYWPQSLSYIMVSSFREAYVRDESRGILRGNVIYDVEVISSGEDGTYGSTTALTPLFDNRTRFCPGLSPDGTRFIALHYSDSGYPEIWFLNSTGNIVESIFADYFEAHDIWDFECPTWQPDAQAIYFLGRTVLRDSMRTQVVNASFYRYVLGTEEPVKTTSYDAFHLEGSLFVGDELTITPDGSAVAFNYTLQGTPLAIGIATTNREVLRLAETRPYGVRLLWFPENE
jgi:Tol biopolymer transport system component